MKTKEQIQQINDRLSQLRSKRWNSNVTLVIACTIFVAIAIIYLATGKQLFPHLLYSISGIALVVIIIAGIIGNKAAKQRDLLDAELLKDIVEKKPVPGPLPAIEEKWPSWAKAIHAIEAADHEKNIESIIGLKIAIIQAIDQKDLYWTKKERIDVNLAQIDRWNDECEERVRYLTQELPQEIADEREDALQMLAQLTVKMDHLRHFIRHYQTTQAPKVHFEFPEEERRSLAINETVQKWSSEFESDPDKAHYLIDVAAEFLSDVDDIEQVILNTVAGYARLHFESSYWKTVARNHQGGRFGNYLEKAAPELFKDLAEAEQRLSDIEQRLHEAALQAYSPAHHLHDRLGFETAQRTIGEAAKTVARLNITGLESAMSNKNRRKTSKKRTS
jgi:hypothetical protein